jgi:predicted TIM-barrel fold metal-dependent hydrolase
MKIDIQSHCFPEPVIRYLERRADPPRVARGDGMVTLVLSPAIAWPMPAGMNDLTLKLEAMDKNGVDVQVLSLNAPGPERLAGPEADELARIAHDALAEFIGRRPDRFWGIATLGFHVMEASLRELDRAVKVLGFKGVQLFSNIRGKGLDDPFLHPLYARCQELELPIFLHPTVPVMEAAGADYHMNAMVGVLFDTTLAALRLILSGTLEKFPRLAFVLPHVGSTIPYLQGRIDHLSGALPGGRQHIRKAPSEYFQRFCVDSVSSFQPAIDYCYRLVGADRILFGTDYPWVPVELSDGLVAGMPISKNEKEKIYSGNALRLLRK